MIFARCSGSVHARLPPGAIGSDERGLVVGRQAVIEPHTSGVRVRNYPLRPADSYRYMSTRVAPLLLLIDVGIHRKDAVLAQPTSEQLAARYERITEQLAELFSKIPDPTARMATAVAILHYKMPHFFWTGFYRLLGEELLVGPYQGPLACAVLEKPEGVCWAGVMRGRSILVPDVEKFPGHIACDSSSRSEVVVPLRDAQGTIVGVLDVDSAERDAFSATDVAGLEAVVKLIYPASRDLPAE